MIFKIILNLVLLVFSGNPDFYDSGGSGSLAIIVLVPRPENDEIEIVLLVLFGNPDFYDSGWSGSLAIIVFAVSYTHLTLPTKRIV